MMLLQSLPDLLLGELRQPAHAHPCLHILKLPSEHLGLPGTGAGMLHNLPQGSNQDTEEDHAGQHHHCRHTLQQPDQVSLGTTLLLMWCSVSQVTHQDTEEDHACQHHHCCRTLHHTRSSQYTEYTAGQVTYSFPSDPSAY